jgi:hypothetical protein
MWSSADDSVRIATIRAIHRLASAPDESILDLVLKVRARIQTDTGTSNPHNFLKNTYQTLLKSSKNTTAHSLPSITFMKNSASEILCLNRQAAYQHAFRFIRQLAIHLRNSMKLKTKVCHNSNISANDLFGKTHRSRTNRFIIGNMSMPLTFGPWSLHELARSKGLLTMPKTGT